MEAKQEFPTQETYVQALADEYVRIKKEMFTLSQQEKEVISAVESEIDESNTDKTVTLEGESDNIKVERRENISYPRERGETHPLRLLMSIFDEILEDKVNVTYEESGNKIGELMDRVVKGKPHTEEEGLLAAELEKVRVVKRGKPGISIVSRKS